MTEAARQHALELDAADPLGWMRSEFVLPEDVVYLDGNSLGPVPRSTEQALLDVVRRQWGRDLIRSWNTHGWFELPLTLGDEIAPLIGAGPGEVVAADSTSVVLFQLLAAAVRLRPERPVILSEAGNFPTDLYIAQGLEALLGGAVELRTVPGDRVADAVDDRTAVVMLTHVDFRTGRMHDLEAVTAAAHRRGALALWDLAHSAGAVPVDLSGSGADMAVGCGYKYLNGGPGAPAFGYVARRHHDSLSPPLWGWMGHAEPFAFEPAFRPAPGIARLRCGTPSILGMIALSSGVRLLARAGIGALRRKSVALCELFLERVRARCDGLGLEIACPSDPARRGSQVSLRHPHGLAVVQALIARGVIGDFREPDLMRFGLAPAFLRHVDVVDAVEALRDVLTHDEWSRPEHRRRPKVT